MKQGEFLGLLALGAVDWSLGGVLGLASDESGWVQAVLQLGALGLLAIYLFWGIKERREDRDARVSGEKAERDARLAEITAIATAHKEQLAQTIEALQRAYEGRKGP